jgi:hypothetical protein
MEKKGAMNAIFKRMNDLEFKIAMWNGSQSNPGAVMDLRDMRKELEKIKRSFGVR